MRTNQELSRLSAERIRAQDWHGYCALFHPTESVYIDPFFGELKGQDKIRTWFTSVMSEATSSSTSSPRRRVAFDVLFEPTLCGDTVVVESLMKAVNSDGTATALARFCHVERYLNGWIVYAADYYDTHLLRQQLARASQRTGIGPPPG